MITLTVDNSYSRIEGLTAEAFRSLKKALSYEVDPQQAYYQGGHRPRTKSLLDAKGYFPTGLLIRVKVWLLSKQIRATFKGSSRPPVESAKLTLDLGHREPYHAQLAAVQAALDNPRGIISMPTGTGKSLVIALLLYTFQMRTLIVVPTLELKRQLYESLAELLGPTALYHVVVENIDSPTLAKHTNFDMLLIDEGHHVAASTYHKLNKTTWKGIYYRYFLTATPFRNQTNEQMLFEAIAGQVIYKLSYKEAVDKGYIVPIEAYYFEVPKQRIDGHTWAEVYKETVTQNDLRNGMVADFLRYLETNKKSTLCLVKEVAHGKRLSALSGIPFASGADEESRQYLQQFAAGRITSVIATSGIAGEGLDTKPCEFVVIAGLGKAKSAFMQQCGRVTRNFPLKETGKVFLWRDPSHKWCLKHFNEQVKILKEEYGVEAKKMKL